MEIIQNGTMVTVDGHTAERLDVVVEISDYNDGYYDVGFARVSTGELFGDGIYAGIRGINATQQKAKELADLAGVKIRKRKISSEQLQEMGILEGGY